MQMGGRDSLPLMGRGQHGAEEEAGARLLGSHCSTWGSGPRILQEREKAFWV